MTNIWFLYLNSSVSHLRSNQQTQFCVLVPTSFLLMWILFFWHEDQSVDEKIGSLVESLKHSASIVIKYNLIPFTIILFIVKADFL